MVKSEFSSFVAAYQKADPEIQEIIDGPAIPDFVDEFVKKYPNTIKYRKDLIDIIADIVLGLISLRAALENIRTDKETEGLFSEDEMRSITDFVSTIRSTQHVIDSLADSDVPTPEPKLKDAQLTSVIPSIQTGTNVSEIISQETSPVEEAPNKAAGGSGLKPLRTFADDVAMSRAHTYGAFRSTDDNDGDDDTPTYHSNQDDIIKK